MGFEKLRERLAESFRAAHMLDVQRAEKYFCALIPFLFIIFSIGATLCAFVKDGSALSAGTLFVGFMVVMILLALYISKKLDKLLTGD